MPMKRKIVKIDESKCNGCGLCVPACAEGALQIIEGKARLISERYCDGLGACLGECPQGAIIIEEREAEAFDEAAVAAHLASMGKQSLPPNHQGEDYAPAGHHPQHLGGCPGSRTMVLKKGALDAKEAPRQEVESELAQWPVQLTLVPVQAPYFKNAGLLVAADCVPFAYANFHARFLRGHALVVGCPKLDDTNFYVEKLTEIISLNQLKDITIVNMEVPCCFGLRQIVQEAMARANRSLPVMAVTISVRGELQVEHRISA